MDEIVDNGIKIYQFPTADETVADQNRKMNVSTHTCTLHPASHFAVYSEVICAFLIHLGGASICRCW